MKEHIELITDSFTDYAGEVHHFVIAAISQMLPTGDVTYEVIEYNDDYGQTDDLGIVTKVLRIGISICNPIDTFDEKIGAMKAISRARNSEPVLYATQPGVINTCMVKGLLQQEAQYFKNNPDKYIPGYDDACKRYHTTKEMEALKKDFSNIENQVLEGLQKDSKFLDRVMKYLKWIR